MNAEVAKAIGMSCGCYTFHDDWSCTPPTYTVDDLLAWLMTNTRHTHARAGHAGTLVVWGVGDRGLQRTPDTPTLLEALEQAVLAVAEEAP